MKVLVVGAGASGVISAINYKRHNPNDEVIIIEHLDKPLKKLLATGNGKCNLGNAHLDYSLFNNSHKVEEICKDYDYESLFNSIGIQVKHLGDLAYPVSESAVSVREALLNQLRKLNISIFCNEKLIDYKISNQIEVETSSSKHFVDKLILAGGAKSSSKLGSDGSVLEILSKHGYEIKKCEPGLCPMYTKEKTKSIDGVRVKANVKLICENKTIHEELGEVLFKEHGLSGIVIFNTMSYISRSPNKQYKISIDLIPDFSEEFLKNYSKFHTFEEILLAFINPKISDYLINRFIDKDKILKSLKNLEFTFDKPYGFDFSQVSVGGVNVSQVNEKMMSKIEHNVYIIGELLDIDGPCGGYNLTWAFASASIIE